MYERMTSLKVMITTTSRPRGSKEELSCLFSLPRGLIEENVALAEPEQKKKKEETYLHGLDGLTKRRQFAT